MMKVLNILSMISAILTMLTMIFTLLTTYQFVFLGQIFNSYYSIQICIAVTMFFWTVRFFLYERGWKRVVYPLFSFCIFVGAILFIVMYVK